MLLPEHRADVDMQGLCWGIATDRERGDSETKESTVCEGHESVLGMVLEFGRQGPLSACSIFLPERDIAQH